MSLAWGGFSNGSIPATSLHEVPNFAPLYAGVSVGLASNKMMTEAAVQFSGLAKAFYKHFGKPLNVSEAYRRLDRQQSLYADYRAGRGNLAAYPGTSNHGWGRSLDLASNVNINKSAENTWARQNAPAYGFNFTVPSEAWHVDYLGSPSVHVNTYISNPNITSDAPKTGSTTSTGDDMDKIIRNKKTGSVDWVNVATGFWWHVPQSGYVGAIEAHIGQKTEDMEDNWWNFYKARAQETRDTNSDNAAKKVWASSIDGFNGKHGAGARLAGIDKKADTLSPDSVKQVVSSIPIGEVSNNTSPGAVQIDSAALAKALAPLITAAVAKAVNDDAAKRMQS